MKNISIVVFSLLMLTLFVGCEEEINKPSLPDISDVPEAAITQFNLISPASNVSVNIDPNETVPLEITWEAVEVDPGQTATYTWLADTLGGDFSNPVLELPSDNSGADPMLTITHQQVDDALAALGFEKGDVAKLIWNVRATAGGSSRLAITARRIDLKRNDPFIIRIRQLPTNTPADQDIFIAGEMQNIGVAPGNWQQPGTNPDLKFTKDTDGSYFIALDLAPNTPFEFKFFLATTDAPDWSKGEQFFDANGNCFGSNRRFTWDGVSKTVEFGVPKWENVGGCPTTALFEVTVPAGEVPDGKSVFLAGEFGAVDGIEGFSNWQQPGTNPLLEMSETAPGVWTLRLPLPSSTTLQYKYFVAATDAPSWDNGEADIGCNGTGNRSFTYTGSNSAVDTADRFSGVGSCN